MVARPASAAPAHPHLRRLPRARYRPPVDANAPEAGRIDDSS